MGNKTKHSTAKHKRTKASELVESREARHTDPKSAAFNDKVYQLDDMGWANDINSFKCGKHAYLELCKYPGDLKSN